MEILISFATTYFCETGFRTLLEIKNKARNRLNPHPDLRSSISNMNPRIDELVKDMQQQTSH